VLPRAAHARQVVLELRQLYLQLSLGGDRVLREDVEDQLRPVDDAGLQRIFEVALLRRLELAVDDQRLGAELGVGALRLFELPLADVRPRGRARAALDDRPNGVDPSRAGQLLHLRELGFLVVVGPKDR
jgi:hypothetical protein